MRPGESFVGQPIRSLQTMLRLIAKDTGRIPLVVPDGIYGANTMQTVIVFQRNSGLPATGIVDQKTWDAIVAQYEPALIRVGKAESIEVLMEPGQVFRDGDQNPYIYLAQSMLTQLSNTHSIIPQPSHSGKMDRQTADSLRSFQNLNTLPCTGELDRITWKHLVSQFTLDTHHQNRNEVEKL